MSFKFTGVLIFTSGSSKSHPGCSLNVFFNLTSLINQGRLVEMIQRIVIAHESSTKWSLVKLIEVLWTS